MNGNFYSKDGFQYFRKTNKISDILDDRLVIESDKIDKTVEYVNDNRITTITVNPFISKVSNLDFLKHMDSVEGIYLLQDNLDLSPINHLKLLKVLHIDRIDDTLDFRNFKDLQVLGATSGKTLGSLGDSVNLFWLWLDNYKSDDITHLSNLKKLNYLNLHKTTIKNLIGIEMLRKLKELNIDSAPRLSSLDGLSSTNKSLVKINIHGAKNLVNYDALANLTKVENIYFSKCGNIENFDFVSNLSPAKTFAHGGKYIVKK